MENFQNPTNNAAIPPKKSRAPLIIAGIVVVSLALVLIFVLVTLSNNASSKQNGDDNDNDYYFPEPDIRYVSGTFDQETLSGDTVVSVKVTNLGDAIGSATINVKITESSGTYSNSREVTLAPGVTQTYQITFNTPFGTTVTSSMVDVGVIE